MEEVQRPDIEGAASQVNAAGRLGDDSHAEALLYRWQYRESGNSADRTEMRQVCCWAFAGCWRGRRPACAQRPNPRSHFPDRRTAPQEPAQQPAPNRHGGVDCQAARIRPEASGGGNGQSAHARGVLLYGPLGGNAASVQCPALRSHAGRRFGQTGGTKLAASRA